MGFSILARNGLCSIMIFWFFLVSALVPGLVSLLVSGLVSLLVSLLVFFFLCSKKESVPS